MKANQLKPILQHYSQLLAESDPTTASKLESLSEPFDKLGAQTLKKILNSKSIARTREKLQSADFAKDRVSQHIRWLADLLHLAGVKSAIEVAELARVLDEELWQSSAALIAILTAPKNTGSGPQPVRLDIVRTYSDELARFEHDNNAFDHLIARIKSDRNVRKQEMQEIACRFFGYRVTPDSKQKLLQKIIDMQAKDARQEARTS